MIEMKALAFMLIVILIFVCLFLPRTHEFNEILQVPIHKLTDDLLFENQPILISDNIVSLDQVVNVSFTWGMYISKHSPQVICNVIKRNKYKYLLCHNNTNGSNNIVLENVEIILKPGNIIIIPYGLNYQCKNKMLIFQGLHSLSTLITP